MPDYPIYCINLEHRKDRKEHSLTQFVKLGISPETVIYPHFVKDKRGGVYGCFDSHMKIWKDFYTNYPDAKYALVFEDDFVVSDKTMGIINDAARFIDDNYNAVDVLLLHNHCFVEKHPRNNHLFTNGLGLTTAAGFVSRRYIQSILDKYGKFPEATGRHFDYEMNENVFDHDVMIYTENVFYTREPCITQLIGEGDNASNIIDALFRKDIDSQVGLLFNVLLVLFPNTTRQQKLIIGRILNIMYHRPEQNGIIEQLHTFKKLVSF